MRFAELLIQYNGFLLIFSATGFLISLVWYSFAEKSKRKSMRSSQMLNDNAFDEQVFFDDFENLENPAMTDTLKPIFEKSINPESENYDLVEDEVQIREKKFSKLNDLPQFPILKKEINETLKADTKKEMQIKSKNKKKKFSMKEKNKNTEDSGEVQNLLNEIKKDIKNKKG